MKLYPMVLALAAQFSFLIADSDIADSSIGSTVDRPIADRSIADRVLVNLHHPEGRVLILQSDLRPDLAGNVPDVQDLLLKELILLDAKKLRLPVSEADVDRHIARVQEQLKMTRADLIDFFKERGRTFEEAKKELEKGLIMEMTVEHRVKSKAQVPLSEIEAYHKEHPLAHYTIRQAFVPFAGGSKAIARALIEREIESGAINKTVSWQDPMVVQDEDFSAEKAYIKDLAPQSIVIAQESDDGMTLLKLEEKKVVSFDERKQEIAMLLGKDRYKNAYNNYCEQLLKSAKPYTRFVAKPV